MGGAAARTTVCRNCGALVGSGETRCMLCGAVAEPARREHLPAGSARRGPLGVLRAIVGRPAAFTFVFIAAEVFLYTLMRLAGGAAGDVLLAYGAKRNDLVEAGQWWRLVTASFLHADVRGLGALHFVAGVLGLFVLGPYVERLYGSAKFVTVWVLAGAAGMAAAYLAVRPELAQGGAGRMLFGAYDVPAAGASGALLGLAGVLVGYGLKYRRGRVFIAGVLPVVAVNLFVGYVGRGAVPNAAHLGGLVAGLALAPLLEYGRGAVRVRVAYAWHFAQAVCLVLLVAGFVAVGLNFGEPPPPRPTNARAREANGYGEAVNAGQNALLNFTRGRGEGLAPAIKRLEEAPRLSEGADELNAELRALLRRAQQTEAARDLSDGERAGRVAQLNRDLAGWQERFGRWVAAEGEDFGLKFQKAPEDGSQ